MSRYLIFLFVVIVLLSIGLSGMILGIIYGSWYSDGQIIKQNNQWESDGYTYTNYTVFVSNETLQETVKCNYYHMGGQMEFSVNDFAFFNWNTGWLITYIPKLPEGC